MNRRPPKPIEVLPFRMRKRHLFNECNNERVFPETYAKCVNYVLADGTEIDLQTYLDDFTVDIDTTSLSDAIDELKEELQEQIDALDERLTKVEEQVKELNAKVDAICDFLNITLSYDKKNDKATWEAEGTWHDNGVAYFKSNETASDGGGLFAADAVWVSKTSDSETHIGVINAEKFMEEKKSDTKTI